MTRKIIALDIDGVVRPLAVYKDEERTESLFEKTSIIFDKRDYPTLFHGAPQWDADGLSRETIYINRHAKRWLQKKHREGVEIQWATTWVHFANKYFAPKLGLPELPVMVKEDAGDDIFHGVHRWKAMQIAKEAAGDPVIWLDDSTPGEPRDTLRYWTDGAAKLHSDHFWVEGYFGLTPAMTKLIDLWLEDPAKARSIGFDSQLGSIIAP